MELAGGDAAPQVLTLDVDVLTLSDGGGYVDLSEFRKGLELDENVLTISDGPDGEDSVDLSDFQQELSFSAANNVLTISNGNSVDLSALAVDTRSYVVQASTVERIGKEVSSSKGGGGRRRRKLKSASKGEVAEGPVEAEVEYGGSSLGGVVIFEDDSQVVSIGVVLEAPIVTGFVEVILLINGMDVTVETIMMPTDDTLVLRIDESDVGRRAKTLTFDTPIGVNKDDILEFRVIHDSALTPETSVSLSAKIVEGASIVDEECP